MRIVMVTDDLQIDRRIVQEGETLAREGHEIILLAREGAGYAAHIRLGSIKVERVDLPDDGTRERLAGMAFDAVARAVSAIAERIPSGAVHRHVERNLRRARGLLLMVVRRTRRLPYRDAVVADRIAYYRPDVVHAHDLPQLRPAVVAADRVGAAVVYDAHELYPEIGTLPSPTRRRLEHLERTLTPRCDVVITVNPYIADEMADRYHVPRPVVVLNAVDPLPPRSERSNRIREALELGTDAPILLFQGWMSPTRGLDALLAAVARTERGAHVVMLGYGDLEAHLRTGALRLGIPDRMHVLPAVPQADLLEWTESADAGVIPYPAVDLNHRLCSPNKLFEFIQAGLPIVANDLPYLRDVVVGEGIGVVAPIDDTRRFAAAIDVVLDPERRSRFALSVHEVAPRYTWLSQEPALLNAYASLPQPRVRRR